MPNSARKTSSTAGEQETSVSFESALQELESILDTMEDEDLPLETLLTLHEKGVALHKVCQAKLQRAAEHIQSLEKDESGEFRLKPLTPDPLSE